MKAVADLSTRRRLFAALPRGFSVGRKPVGAAAAGPEFQRTGIATVGIVVRPLKRPQSLGPFFALETYKPSYDFEDRLKNLLIKLMEKGTRADAILYTERLPEDKNTRLPGAGGRHLTLSLPGHNGKK